MNFFEKMDKDIKYFEDSIKEMKKWSEEVIKTNEEIKFDNDVAETTEWLWHLQEVGNILENLTYKDMYEMCADRIKVEYDFNDPKFRNVNNMPSKEWLIQCDVIDKYRNEVFREVHKQLYKKWYIQNKSL